MEGWEGGGAGGGEGGRGRDTPQNESKIKTESCCKIIDVVYRAAVDTKMHTALILKRKQTLLVLTVGLERKNYECYSWNKICNHACRTSTF